MLLPILLNCDSHAEDREELKINGEYPRLPMITLSIHHPTREHFIKQTVIHNL